MTDTSSETDRSYEYSSSDYSYDDSETYDMSEYELVYDDIVCFPCPESTFAEDSVFGPSTGTRNFEFEMS